MKLRLKRSLAAAALASVLMAATFCQAQQPANDKDQPEANAPQTTPPQPENPTNGPGEDKDAPAEKHDDQTAQQQNPPSPANESTPALQTPRAQPQASEFQKLVAVRAPF